MRKRFLLCWLLPLVALTLTACAGNPEENPIRQVVANAERAFEDALKRQATADAFLPYFATPEEGANAQGLANTRDLWQQMWTAHVGGARLTELSNFRITDVQVHESGGLARVRYQVDVKIGKQVDIPVYLFSTQQATATMSQNLALLKTTTRGWRIMGGDARQFSNVVGQLPQ